MVTDAMHCVELPATVSFDEGACFFGNPLTAVMMLDVIKQGKHRAVVQSAAASALSKMVLRLCHAEGIPVVNIVRRPAQVRALQDLGAEFVLNSDDTAFDQDLKALCSRLQVSVGFDSVAGEMTGTMLQALMPGGTAYVLGVLSGQPASGLTGQDLIFHKKRVEGLNLRDWLASSSSYKKLRAIKQVSSQLSTVFKTDIVQRYSLEQFEQALHTYQVNMSAGKVLFAPS
jgi:NADPH:quinone reductase-like Zn-dependent oxidoreductase